MKKVMITNYQLAKDERAYKQAAINSNVDIIIFREKWASDKQAAALISSLRQEIDIKKTTLVINYHHRLALKLGVNNLHFSFADYKSEEKWIASFEDESIKCGVSIHSLEQLKEIDQSLVDYLLVGTIFKTDCKPGIETKGVEGLEEIISNTNLPIIAIGGITDDNIHLIQELNIFGVAQMSSYYH